MRFSLVFSRAFAILLWHALPLLGVLALLISLGGYLIARIDGLPVSTGIYFAWVTSMTVGYGDFTPATTVSRTIAIVVAFLGIPFNGMVVALAIVAARLAIDSHGRLGHMIAYAEARLLMEMDDEKSARKEDVPNRN
jgi:voltage-gated potassium channel Kch